MVSVQKKFFTLLEEAAIAVDMELVVRQEWANTGTIHLQEPGNFDTWLTIPYAFNDTASFGWMVKDRGAPVFPDRPNPYFAGFKANELGEAIDALINWALGQRNNADAEADAEVIA